jgi:hypothetical protein
VSEIFHLLKADDDDTLNKKEFAVVMKILYSQVFTRIVIQWTLTLMSEYYASSHSHSLTDHPLTYCICTIVVPVLSQYIMEYTTLAFWIAHEFWKDIDDDLDPVQRFLYNIWLYILTKTPDWLDDIGRTFVKLLQMVPWETWEGMPRLILNSLLVFVAVPYALNRVEDFFKKVAHKHDESEKVKKD